LTLLTIMVLGTIARLMPVVLLAVWLVGAISIVFAIVAATSGMHPLTHDVLRTLLQHICHFFTCSQRGFTHHDPKCCNANTWAGGSAHAATAGTTRVKSEGPTVDPTKRSLAVATVFASSLLQCALFVPCALTSHSSLAIMLSIKNTLKAAASDICKPGNAFPVVPSAANTCNPAFFEWSAGMCLKVEINDVERLSPQRQPIGSMTPAKGVGLQVIDGGARGMDVSLVIAPSGADGETPKECLLKGVKGRRTAVVTETEHLHLETTSGTKEPRSNQAGTGLRFTPGGTGAMY